MSGPVLDLSLASYAVLVERAGVDPDAEVARFDGTDSSVVYEGSAGWKFAAGEMDAAWTQSWEAQARLEREFLNDGLGVYDRAAHEAMLPVGFRDAGAEMGLIGHRLGAVGTSLSWESAQARNRLVELHAAVESRARVWESRVAEAGLIAPEDADEWLTARDDVERLIVGFIQAGFDSVRGNVTRYEGVVGSALAGLAEQGFTDPADSPGGPGAVVGAPVGDPVVLAGLGTPVQAGFAADPVNTGIGNFVEVESDLGFSGLVAGLGWSRVYNSRAVGGAGPVGPRWASWASARLRVDDVAARYVGPDGQEFTVPRVDGGFGRVPDLAAWILPGGDGGWVLVWVDGRRWSFGADGRPTGIEHGPGTAVGFVYDDLGRLVELVHCGGRRVTLTWAGLSIMSVSSGDGSRVEYRYDDGGRVVRADTPAGSRHYTYDDAGLVATVADADGVVEVLNRYDELGRVIVQRSPHGRETTFTYDGLRTVVADDTGGPVNTYLHDGSGRVVEITDGAGGTIRRSYDVWGSPVRLQGRDGRVTTQEFDGRGRVVRRVVPGGAQVRITYDESDRATSVAALSASPDEHPAVTEFGYDGAERVPERIVDPEGGVTRLQVREGRVQEVIDADGVRARYRFDDDGLIVAIIEHTDADTDGSGEAWARVERDGAGRVTATVSPGGRRTTFTHDRFGRVVARHDPGGAVWRYEYTPAGRCRAVVDPVGARTEIGYGDHGEVTEVADPSAAVTTQRYDVFGNRVGVTTADGTADGASWTYTLDAVSRLTAITDPTGAVWRREYDIEGRLVGTLDPVGTHRTATVDPSGLFSGVHDGMTSSLFDHDGLGRPTAHRRPDGATLSAVYDRCGRRITETAPDGGTTRFTFSRAGRLLRRVSAAGRIERYTYDGAGRVATITDPTEAVWTLRRDLDGAVTERATPTGAWERFTRDDTGRVVHRESSRGIVTTWVYDGAGRVTEVDSSLAGARRFTYDVAGRMVAATDALGHNTAYTYDVAGRLTAVTDPLGGVTRHTHDPAGRVVSSTDPLGGVTRFVYDAAGHLIARTDPTGATVAWELDASARITAVLGEGPDERITIERDALGRPIRYTEPGQANDELTYDITGRLTRRTRRTTPSTTNLATTNLAMTWSYDGDGLRTALGYPDGHALTGDRDNAGRTTLLRHPLLGTLPLPRDPDGRPTTTPTGQPPGKLTRTTTGRISSDRTRRYTYDAAGQLLGADDRTYTYDPCGRLIHETGPAGERDLTYDAAGRLLTAGARTFTYDAAGRRTTDTGPDHQRSFTYDWLGRPTRITTRTPHGTRSTRLRVDALGELATVDDTPLLWDTADPLHPLTRIGERSVITHDQHPLAVIGTGPDIGPPATPTDPWGDPTTGVGLDPHGDLTIDGLTWLRHRIYDPTTRAFTTPDPLPPIPATPYAANPYHYAANDPVNRTDPLGLQPLTDTDMHDDPGLFGAIGNWWNDNWEYVAAGTMAALGVGLMFTGVGGLAGVALMGASGALLAGAGGTAVQRLTNGAGGVDFDQVRNDALIGGVTGLIGGGAGMALARLGGIAGIPAGAQGAAVGALSNLPAGIAGRTLTGHNPLDPAGIAGDVLLGGAAGGVTARLGGLPTTAPEPPGPIPVEHIYRGVPHGHPGYPDAQQGAALPRGGSANAREHNNGDTDSPYTSWTASPGIAHDFAVQGNGPGVVLRTPHEDGATHKIVPSPDRFDEDEVLVEGPVTEADIYDAREFGEEWNLDE